VAEAVSEGFRVSSDLLDAFLKTREEPIEDLVETIRKIADARQFSQKLTDADCFELSGRAGGKSIRTNNAFTNTAQKLGPLQRIEMERFAGTLLAIVLCSFPLIRQAPMLAFFFL
jgi:hypothetical protein